MKRVISVFKWTLCRASVVLALAALFCLPVSAGQMGGQMGASPDAKTVQGKAPAVANGLATLDGSGKVVQDAKTLGGFASSATVTPNTIPVRNASKQLLDAYGEVLSAWYPSFGSIGTCYTSQTITSVLSVIGSLSHAYGVANDLVLFCTHVEGTKGATAGSVTIQLNGYNLTTLAFLPGTNSVNVMKQNITANDVFSWDSCTVGQIMSQTYGLNWQIQASSAGSNVTGATICSKAYLINRH